MFDPLLLNKKEFDNWDKRCRNFRNQTTKSEPKGYPAWLEMREQKRTASQLKKASHAKALKSSKSNLVLPTPSTCRNENPNLLSENTQFSQSQLLPHSIDHHLYPTQPQLTLDQQSLSNIDPLLSTGLGTPNPSQIPSHPNPSTQSDDAEQPRTASLLLPRTRLPSNPLLNSTPPFYFSYVN